MRALEKHVGHPLLLRKHDGVVLTDAGERLLVHADAIASAVSRAQREQLDVARLEAGVVRIAAFPSWAATILPRALTSLRRQAPMVETRLIEAEPPEALELLARDEADIALVFSYDTDNKDIAGMHLDLLATESVRLVMPATDRRARKRIDARDLASSDWIAGCVNCRGHLVRLAHAAGFEAKIRHSTDDYVVVQALVAAELGMALLPEAALAAYTHPRVTVHASTGWGSRQIFAATQLGAARVPAVSAMLEHLRVASAANGANLR